MAQHKHAKVIKAWADGKTVQWWDGSKWNDCRADQAPAFLPQHQYRIKPVEVVVERTVELVRRDGETYVVDYQTSPAQTEPNVRYVFDQDGILLDVKKLEVGNAE